MGSDKHRGWQRGAPWSRGRHPVYVIGWALALLLALHGTAAAQAQIGIASPRPGDTLAGIVLIEGTATDREFLRYELAFRRSGEWIVFAGGGREVQQGTLAVWDTTVGYPGAPVFPDGVYELRLRIVRQDYNYDEYFVSNLVLANSQPTPEPTATAPAEVTAAPPSPSPPEEDGPDGAVGSPTPLPSLTPFPTPTAPPTLASEAGAGLGPPPSPEAEAGLAARLEAIDTGRFSRAFWQGARWAFYGFAALAAYLLLRAIVRRLWRYLLAYVESERGR